ncbi:MAG: hypothetical protein RIB46_14370 [Pseudomonadales bacterium]
MIRRQSLPVMLAIALWPAAAAAHSPMPGFEGFYVGAVHPATVPGQLLALLVLGLLLGVRGPVVARPALVWFLAALVLGLALAPDGGADARSSVVALAVALAGAPLLLWSVRPMLASGYAVAVGLAVGIGLMPEAGAPGAVAITIAGSLVGAPFLVLCVFGATDLLRERLAPAVLTIAARIAGAWLVAIAALLLALAVRAGPPA